jgi:GH15 family glucan-1,4-alpha-glucosidase
MKKSLTIFSILMYSFSYSQSDNDILFIKSKIETVSSQTSTYQITTLKDVKKNSEIAVFTDNSKNIRLIRETYINDNGKTLIWNYIENNHPYFVFKEYYNYKYPVTDKKFNSSKFIKTEEGFYFKNDRVIRWMQGEKKVTKYPKNAANIENNMIMHIEDMIAKYHQQIQG